MSGTLLLLLQHLLKGSLDRLAHAATIAAVALLLHLDAERWDAIWPVESTLNRAGIVLYLLRLRRLLLTCK